MACFLVPAAEALVTTVAGKVMEKKDGACSADGHHAEAAGHEIKIPFTRKIKWLNNMLWGGSALLAFEHVWHGEVAPWFPFLTAAGNPEDAAEMIHEMSTVGVTMALLVTAVWLGMVAVSSAMEKRVNSKMVEEKEESVS